MEIDITKITVILNPHGMDLVSMHTDLPTTTPGVSDENCSMIIYCAKDTGKEYCEKHFPGIPIRELWVPNNIR